MIWTYLDCFLFIFLDTISLVERFASSVVCVVGIPFLICDFPDDVLSQAKHVGSSWFDFWMCRFVCKIQASQQGQQKHPNSGGFG